MEPAPAGTLDSIRGPSLLVHVEALTTAAAGRAPRRQASPRPALNIRLEKNQCFPQITVLFSKLSDGQYKTEPLLSTHSRTNKHRPLLPASTALLLATRARGERCSGPTASPVIHDVSCSRPCPSRPADPQENA